MAATLVKRAKSSLAIVGGGVLGGVLDIVVTVALASLVFSGSLDGHFAAGLGVFLMGTLAITIALGATSSYPSMLGGVQDSTSAILALAAALVAAEVGASAVLPTVVALFAATSVLVGVLLMTIGTLRLGQLVRFLPFPVLAGLLAGTGLLIVIGSVGLMFEGGGDGAPWLVSLLPGVAVALVLVAKVRRSLPTAAVVAVIAAAVAAAYAWMAIEGVGRGESMQIGLLLGPFPDGALWAPDSVASIFDADWSAVFGQWVSLGTVAILVPVSILLYVGAFELALNIDLDGEKELRAAGIANLAAGAVGAPPGFHYMAPTLATVRASRPHRAVPWVAAAVILAVVLGGGPALELVPTAIVAGLLLFIGITFVLDWLWDARRRLPALDLAVVAAISLVIAVFGVLVGAAVGVLAAVGLFIVRYSRAPVVRYEADGRSFRSRVSRPEGETRVLDDVGNRLLVMELQSFLFFGTADRLRRRIVERISTGEAPIRYVVIGFRSVTGMDSSAALTFERLVSLAEKNGFDVMFADLPEVIAEQLAVALQSARARSVADVDRAVEQAENALIAETGGMPGKTTVNLGSVLAEQCSPEDAAVLELHFETLHLPARDVLMRQGEPTRGMYFVTSGEVSVAIETAEGETARLRGLGPGSMVGEMSLYEGGPCSATVVAETPVEVRHLAPDAFRRLREDNPSAASALHLYTTRVLSRRLAAANGLIRSLLD